MDNKLRFSSNIINLPTVSKNLLCSRHSEAFHFNLIALSCIINSIFWVWRGLERWNLFLRSHNWWQQGQHLKVTLPDIVTFFYFMFATKMGELCKCGKYIFTVLALCSKLIWKEKKKFPSTWCLSPYLSLHSPVCEGLLSSYTYFLLQYWGYYSFPFFQSAREKKKWYKQWYWITLYHLAICFLNFLKITAWTFKNRSQNCYDTAYDSWVLHWRVSLNGD